VFDDETKYEWSVITPSDAYTIVGTERLAALALLFTGSGRLGILRTGDDGEEILGVGSVCAFQSGAGDAAVEALLCGGSLVDFLAVHYREFVVCCRSILIGQGEDRVVFERGLAGLSPAEVVKCWECYHDARRSSMLDLGRALMALANRVERTYPSRLARGVTP